MKIELPLSFEDGWRMTEAEIVNVAPHLPLWTWAVHRALDNPRWWIVSSVETGYAVHASAHATRAGCLRLARAFLRTKTPALVERQAAKCMAIGFRGRITPESEPLQRGNG